MSTIDVPVARPPLWRRLVGFNLLTGIIGAAIGYAIGSIVGHAIHAPSLDSFDDIGQGYDLALMNRDLQYERIATVNVAATLAAALTRLGLAVAGGSVPVVRNLGAERPRSAKAWRVPASA